MKLNYKNLCFLSVMQLPHNTTIHEILINKYIDQIKKIINLKQILKMQREKSKAARVLLIISIVFLAITLYVTYYRYAKIQRAIFTTGKIVGFTQKIEEKKEKKRTKRTTFYYPEFEFKDKTGQLVNIKSNAGKGNSPAYNIGEEIEIMYSPDNSSDAQINDFSSLWLPTLVLGIFTLIFSFVTYAVRKKQY